MPFSWLVAVTLLANSRRKTTRRRKIRTQFPLDHRDELACIHALVPNGLQLDVIEEDPFLYATVYDRER